MRKKKGGKGKRLTRRKRKEGKRANRTLSDQIRSTIRLYGCSNLAIRRNFSGLTEVERLKARRRKGREVWEKKTEERDWVR